MKRSLIKSLNTELHIDGTHDHIWKDYITMTFDDERLLRKGMPALSMGISVKDHDQFKYLMRFLNHCNIEQVFQRHILSANEKVDIVEALPCGGVECQKSA